MNAGDILCRQRGRVMGYAALMVIVYHCFFNVQSAVGGFLFETNNKMGVDLFVFLSGFGLALSLNKSTAFPNYFRRRLRRVLPSYYVILACMLPFTIHTLKELFTFIIPVSIWTGNETLWYVSASLGYYLLVYVFFLLLKKSRFPGAVMCLLVALFALAVPPLLSFMHSEIALMRIPGLICGVAFGVFYIRRDAKKQRIADLLLLLLACCGIGIAATKSTFGILSKREASFLAKNLCAPVYALLLALLFDLLDRTPAKLAGRIFDELGKYSLELYFAHLAIKVFVEKFIVLQPIALLALLLAASYPAARVIHWIGRLLLKLWDYIFCCKGKHAA